MKECNICGWTGDEFAPRFKTHGRACVCPKCRSLDRNRHLLYVLNTVMPLDHSVALLDIAPSLPIKNQIAPSCLYLAIDIQGYTEDIIPMNVANLEFPSDYFHVVLCSHVFEHIRDDTGAMREICRVLAPEGVLISQVSYLQSKETKDFDEPDQHGHIRRYALTDYLNRLSTAGFTTETVNHATSLSSYGFDDLNVFLSRRTDVSTTPKQYDYSLLRWLKERELTHKTNTRDYARKPIAS